MLEILAILGFENIEIYQKIYAIICGCLFIAQTKIYRSGEDYILG